MSKDGSLLPIWFPTALVQGWVDGSTPNDGMIVKGHDETTGDMVQFYSSDAPSSTNWPTLTVAYIPRLGMDPVYPLAGAGGVGVNTANGNLVLHATDLAMPGVGLPLVVDRTYNSQCAGPAMPGATSLGADCWQLGTGQDVGLISFGTGSVAYTDGTGQQYTFIRTSPFTYTSPPGIDATLSESSSVIYTLTFHASGEVDTFDAGGYLQSQTDRAGNTLTFTYSGSTGPEQLTSITDTQGRTTSVTYNTAGYLSQITDPAGRTYTYGYDSSNRLTSYTDPAGKITQYAYNYSSTCTCSIKITDPNGHVTTTQGDSSGRVTGITDALLHTTTFTYNSGNTVVTDPNNHATTYYFDNAARTTSVKDALGHTTQASWTSDNNPDTTTLPSGNTSKASYDGNNNPTQVDVHPTSGATVSSKAAFQNGTFPYNPSSSTDAHADGRTGSRCRVLHRA